MTTSAGASAADVATTARAPHATVLGRVKLKLKGHKPVKRVRLTAAGRKLVKKIKSNMGLTVLLKVTLKVPGHKKSTTYTQKLLLLKNKPKATGLPNSEPADARTSCVTPPWVNRHGRSRVRHRSVAVGSLGQRQASHTTLRRHGPTPGGRQRRTMG